MGQALQTLKNSKDERNEENEKNEENPNTSSDQLNSSNTQWVNPVDHLTWVSDLSQTQETQEAHGNEAKDSEAVKQKEQSLEEIAGTEGTEEKNEINKTSKSNKPRYTIPVNATLTGATLMTPLVGRIPIDGKLPSPYSFKLVLSARNLTANGYPLPGIKGAVMSGIASGDMLAECARGDIQSITFVFNDGRISTTEAQGENDSLGYISRTDGNPCIPGSFHSNATIFLGAQMALAGAQGYGNALSQAQTTTSFSAGNMGFSTLIGDANKYAAGQGFSAAALAAQNWWNQRVQNSFDYVYVPNINRGHSMTVVVNISKQININYDPHGRKVSYEYMQLAKQNALD